MYYTPFGEFMRILRARRHLPMRETAEALGVSPSFLSAVEHGRKSVPDGWAERLAGHYGLSEDEARELAEAAALSARTLQVSLDGESLPKRRLAAAFMRAWPGMDDRMAQAALDSLGDAGKEE